MERREFLKQGAVMGMGALWGMSGGLHAAPQDRGGGAFGSRSPVVISTWKFGVEANRAAHAILQVSGSALDAVERGVMLAEANGEITSVGRGGYPTRAGVVELDAAIMDGSNLNAGSVAALQGFLHPVSVARKVMEKTPHVLLVGEGAAEFARSTGFEEENLLTDKAREAWEAWKKKRSSRPSDTHDTIGMVALDRGGGMAASCTTSGMAWKLPGRVGDSPLVGHGLYCDQSVGGAAATGLGEEVIKVCGSYQVVEFMRQGRTPAQAVEAVLDRILARHPGDKKPMVGFIALRADGEVGYGSTTPGFHAAVSRDGEHAAFEAPSRVKADDEKTGEKR